MIYVKYYFLIGLIVWLIVSVIRLCKMRDFNIYRLPIELGIMVLFIFGYPYMLYLFFRGFFESVKINCRW